MNRTIETLLASRPDLTPAQQAFLRRQSPEHAAELLALVPAAENMASRTPTTQGASAGIRAARSSPAVAADIADRFNRQTQEPRIHWEGFDLCFPMISKEEAGRVLARHQKAGPLPRGATLERSAVMAMALAAKGQVHE